MAILSHWFSGTYRDLQGEQRVAGSSSKVQCHLCYLQLVWWQSCSRAAQNTALPAAQEWIPISILAKWVLTVQRSQLWLNPESPCQPDPSSCPSSVHDSRTALALEATAQGRESPWGRSSSAAFLKNTQCQEMRLGSTHLRHHQGTCMGCQQPGSAKRPATTSSYQSAALASVEKCPNQTSYHGDPGSQRLSPSKGL